jgi:hypothetical protein
MTFEDHLSTEVWWIEEGSIPWNRGRKWRTSQLQVFCKFADFGPFDCPLNVRLKNAEKSLIIKKIEIFLILLTFDVNPKNDVENNCDHICSHCVGKTPVQQSTTNLVTRLTINHSKFTIWIIQFLASTKKSVKTENGKTKVNFANQNLKLSDIARKIKFSLGLCRG